MTRKWPSIGSRGTNVEVCFLEMKSPCLLLESYRVRERIFISRVGWSCLAASQAEKKKERASRVSVAFYGAGGGGARAEWHRSFSLDEMYNFKTPTAKTIPALNNGLKFFLLQE